MSRRRITHAADRAGSRRARPQRAARVRGHASRAHREPAHPADRRRDDDRRDRRRMRARADRGGRARASMCSRWRECYDIAQRAASGTSAIAASRAGEPEPFLARDAAAAAARRSRSMSPRDAAAMRSRSRAPGCASSRSDFSAVAMRDARRLARTSDCRYGRCSRTSISFPFRRRIFDAIVNVNFLDRALFPNFKRALRPGGILLAETFLIDQADDRPSERSALPARALRVARAGRRDSKLLRYREGLVVYPDGKRAWRATRARAAEIELMAFASTYKAAGVDIDAEGALIPLFRRIAQTDVRRARARRHRRLRRADRAQRRGEDARAGAGRRHRRRRHQAEGRARDRPPRHHRHRLRRDVRQRHHLPRRAAAVFSRLHRHRQARAARSRSKSSRASRTDARRPA